ncbi:MAG: sugar ABC transporter ATP-binding protein [Solirubrobacterales bacterium]|nr:sugar ABC transporter ATP-binding protein [Solirubrobacterales bacterium]
MSTPATGPHIELRDVSKRFGDVQALSGIDLTIERGSIHGLVGENGAGKSTLGKIIAGIHRPDGGELRVNGRSVSYRSAREALAHGITMIAQEPTLVPLRSVQENVFLGIEENTAGVVNQRVLSRRYSELVRESAIELPPGQLARTLRVADQQKAEILRAIARKVSLIVMDEPSSALTRDESQRLFDLIRGLRAKGTTIVYVSHLLSEVIDLADTVTVLRDGRLIRTAAAENETPERLVSAMLGRSIDVTFPEKKPPPADAPVVLSVQGLSRPPAVQGVSFDIRAGEIVGLAGVIGSGRSEVARGIFGADRLAGGEVKLDGVRLRLRSPREAIRNGIVMLPEDRKSQGLLLLRPIVDNVTLPYLDDVSQVGVIRRRAERRQVGQLVKRLDLRAKSDRARAGTLSGGNQQKVLFARWLFQSPRVLVADEPTRGVDIGAKLAIYELIQSLAAEGLAVLLISSEHEEVLGLAHRVLVMRAGRIVAELDRETMSEDAVLRAALAADSDPGQRVA